MSPRQVPSRAQAGPSKDSLQIQRSHGRAPTIDSERFDLRNLDSGSDSDDPVRGREVTIEAETQVNDPGRPRGTPKITDIQYFFFNDGVTKECRVCRAAKDADPSLWSNLNFSYSVKTSSGTVRKHIMKNHNEEFLRLAKVHGWAVPGQSQASDSVAPGAQQHEEFSQEKFQELLVHFVIADDQAINLVECPEFRALLTFLQPGLKVPRRSKLRGLVLEYWSRHCKNLRQTLVNALGEISFTVDIWSDQNLSPFIAMTAHWIAGEERSSSLRLQSALIAFHRIYGCHDGPSLAKLVFKLINRAGITRKVGYFTMDGATNNDTMLTSLAGLLKTRGIDFDPYERRITCYAHIINLCSARVIQNLPGVVVTYEEGAADLANTAAQTSGGSLVRNPVALARAVVRVIRGSNTRRAAFRKVIDDGNENGWFVDNGKVVILKPLQLLRDVRTRWDSVYYMLNRLRELRFAVDHYFDAPNNKTFAKYKISSREWQSMQDVEIVLGIPHAVQQVMSREQTPILSGAIPSFEMFMSAWEALSDNYPHLKSIVKPGLDWAVKYYNKMDRTDSYIIAMLLNPAIRVTWMEQQWGKSYVEGAREKILETMLKYRADSATPKSAPPANTVTEHAAQGAAPSYMQLAEQYGLAGMNIGGRTSNKPDQTTEQEYIAYVTSALSPENVDILKFWETNRTAFPTLYSMSLDYLPVQASSVPCERVFSSSAETDTKRRNRIHPILMEALQVQKYHLKKDRLDFTRDWITSEAEMVEDDPEYDLLNALSGDNVENSLNEAVKFVNHYESEE